MIIFSIAAEVIVELGNGSLRWSAKISEAYFCFNALA